MTSQLLAQVTNIGGTTITGPLVGITKLSDVINKILPFIMSIAGIILFLILLWGGYDVMMSQGTPEKMKSGRAKITAGIVGFLLLVLSYFFTKLISTIFGFGEGML